MKISKIIISSIITLASLPCAYGNPVLRGKSYVEGSTEADPAAEKGIEVDFAKIKFVKSNGRNPALTKKDVEMLIPRNLRPTSDRIRVENEITRHFLQNLAKAPIFRRVKVIKSVSKAAAKVENIAKIEVKGRVLANDGQKAEIKHKFDFKLQAIKGEARIIYKGYVDSELTYFQNRSNLVFRANKNLSENSVLSLVHSSAPIGSSQTLNYRYTW